MRDITVLYGAYGADPVKDWRPIQGVPCPIKWSIIVSSRKAEMNIKLSHP